MKGHRIPRIPRTHVGGIAGNARRVSRFVEKLFERHAISQRSMWRMLELVLRRANPSIVLRRVRHEGDFHFSPRLALTITRWGSPGGDKDAQIPVPRLALAREQIILRQYANNARLVTTELMVRHLITRCERVETWLQARPDRREAANTVQSNIEADGPTTKIFRRPPFLEVEKSSAAAPYALKSEESGAVRMKSSVSPRPVDTALDVKRLTDQVIQAIDRRIVAQRERTGRV